MNCILVPSVCRSFLRHLVGCVPEVEGVVLWIRLDSDPGSSGPGQGSIFGQSLFGFGCGFGFSIRGHKNFVLCPLYGERGTALSLYSSLLSQDSLVILMRREGARQATSQAQQEASTHSSACSRSQTSRREVSTVIARSILAERSQFPSASVYVRRVASFVGRSIGGRWSQ